MSPDTIDALAHAITERVTAWMETPLALITKGLDLKKAHEDDAAYDLEACERDTITLYPGAHGLIRTGIYAAVPKKTVGLICSRSGLALKHGIFVLNAPGVIDAGYRGEIGVILFNGGVDPFVVRPGDRIAQLLIVPLANHGVVNSGALFDAMRTSRGAGGFGSTGVA